MLVVGLKLITEASGFRGDWNTFKLEELLQFYELGGLVSTRTQNGSTAHPSLPTPLLWWHNWTTSEPFWIKNPVNMTTGNLGETVCHIPACTYLCTHLTGHCGEHQINGGNICSIWQAKLTLPNPTTYSWHTSNAYRNSCNASSWLLHSKHHWPSI